MCSPDPNAGERRAAKEKNNARVAKYNSDGIKFWNKETSFQRGEDASVLGFSRAKSDAYTNALSSLSQGRQASQNLEYKYRKSLFKSTAHQEGRSRRAGMGAVQQVLRTAGEIEHGIDLQFSRNYDARLVGATRQFQKAKAKNFANLGMPPEFGAPTMMPPRDKGGQLFNNINMGLSIASAFTPGGAAGGMMSFLGLNKTDSTQNTEAP